MSSTKPQPVKMYQVKEKLLRPALTSTFECYIPNPNISGVQFYDSELLSFSCYEASLPGSNLLAHEATDDHTGVTEKFAYRKNYDGAIDLSFYVDHRDTQGYKTILFFESWMRYITNDSSVNKNSNFSYRVKYPDEPGTGYRKELYITKFERDFKGDLLVYNFLKAFPIAMSSMPVSYSNSDLLRCRVTFSYDRYVIKSEGQFLENSFDIDRTGSFASVSENLSKNPLSGSAPDSIIRSTSTNLF